MQRIIFRQDSKQLNRVNNISVFSGEKDVDFLEFLIPLEYNGVDLSDCNVRMSYVTGNGFEHSFLIDEYKKEELYEDEYFIYLVPVSPRFTSVEGTVNAYLSITKTVDGEEQKILKTGDVEILIRDHLSDSSQLDEEDIEIIDQVVLKAQWAVDEVERVEQLLDDKVDKSTTIADISLENNIDADDLAGNVLTVYATRSVEDRDFYTKDEVDNALDDKLDKDKLGRGLRINGSNLESTAMMYVTGDVVPENGQFTIPSAISTTARVGDIYYCTTNQRAYLITTVGRYNLAYVEPFNDIVFKNSDPITESGNSNPINKILKPGVIYVNTSTNNMWMCKTKTYDNPYYHYTWISMSTKQIIESENNPPTSGFTYKIGDEWIKSGSQVFMLVKISGNHPPFDYTWKDLTEQVDLTAGNGIDIDNNVINVDLSNANDILKFTVDNQKQLWADGNAIANDSAFKATMPFINEIRQNLTSGNNYPLASKQYVDGLMSGALKRLIVDQLPTQDIDTNTIYMVLRSAPTTNNIYDEYLYVKVSDDPETYDWELIGNTEIDLSNYYTKNEVYSKTEIDTLLLAKQDVITEGDYIDINNNVVSVKTGKTYGYKLLSNGIMTQVNVSDNKSFVIDNVKVGSGLPSDHTTGYVEFSYSDTFSDAVTIKNGDIFNIQNKDYIYLRFTRTLGSGSAGVDYSILSRDDYLATGEDLDVKADKSDTYTKEETNTFLNAKADKDTTYTKTETDNLLDDKENKIAVGDGLKREGNVVSVDRFDSENNALVFSSGKLNVSRSALARNSGFRMDLTSTNYANPLASKQYVDNLISTSLKRLVVEQLPQNPNTYTIYMVLRQAPTTNNIYDEYMYINNAWELIGNTEVDLSNYYTKTESDNKYQPIIDSIHKVSADNIDDSTGTNKFTNTTEKTGWNETKNDVEQIERDYFTYGDNYNMLNPTNSVKGMIGTTGNVSESSTSPYLVSEYIEVKQGKTYALTYKNATYLTRFSMIPNRMCFFDTSKTFKEQSTSSSTTGTYFNSEIVTVAGVYNTKYYKFTPLQDGYIRFQYSGNLNECQMAEGDVYEYMDYYTPPLVLANEVVAENNLTRELQQKINGENGLYEFNYVKLHEKVLFAGDSLTEGYQRTDDIRKDKSYPTIASKLMNCEGVNKGVSGITTLAWWQNYGSQIDYSDYDGLFVYLGTNGGLTDTVEEDTASGDYHTYAETNTGGYCAVIAKALDDNPDIKIYVVKYGTTKTSNITQEIADKYGVPTILVTDTRYFTLTDSFYHTDMTHYNSVGYWALANVLMIQVEEYIEEHLADYTDLPSAKMTSYQPLIDSTHKLDADLVDDTNTTNKFVSANEKSTWNAKADNTTISTDTTSTTVSLTLADNHEYRYTQDLTSLTLTMPNGDFISSIVFASGSTPTSMTYDSNIKWSGNDVSSNAFVPQANMEYEIVFWYNGLSVNAVVRGVA